MRIGLLTVALLGCAPKLAAQPAPHPASLAWKDRVDWSSTGDEAVEMLSEYLKIDTVNPTGNESRGADYLEALLARDGIGVERLAFAPGRDSLIARLSADEPAERPLCLLSHIDVVPSEAEEWPAKTGPLSGAIDSDGVLWGRGALDMKGMGILQIQALSLLRRLNVPLRRDVIVLAVADEEVADRGMLHVIAERWPDLDCGHVLNEGGFGVSDALVDGQTVHAISVGEKGVVWVDVVATAEPGHGSTPTGDSSIVRLRAAMQAIDKRRAEVEWHPMLMELLGRVGAGAGGATGFVLRRPVLVKTAARGQIMGNPLTRAAITTTVHLTGLAGAVSPNVLPGEARATYDIRLQPGVDREAILEELRGYVEGIDGITIEATHYFPAEVSEWRGDPVYDAMVAHVLHERDGHVAGPFLAPGFTDSIFARQQGAVAYGLIPFVVSAELLASTHGHRERVPVSEVQEGSKRFFAMVVQAAARLDAPVSGGKPAMGRPVPTADHVRRPPADPAPGPSEIE